MQDISEENQNRSPNASSPTDAQNLSDGGSLYADDSPELLRWRADILLDEMMLGAVDIAAGRSDIEGASGETPDSTRTARQESPTSPSVPESTGSRYVTPQTSAASSSSDRSETFGANSFWDSEDSRRPVQPSAVHGSPQSTSSSSGAALPGVQANSFLRPPTASATISAQGAAPSDPRYGSASATAPWGEAVDVRRPFDSQDRRSNLLPRESQFDVTSHLNEIERLELDLEMALPAEHEWSVRSRHLLAKAASILKSSPERSAEVDYYLQQVRAIFERAQQTDQWSKVYVKRLAIYLISWASFSAVGLVACLLYLAPLTTSVVDWFSAPADGYLSQHTLPLLVTLLAGTLGAALGALRNMARYRRLGRGYIDRKYSLRTLLLPLLALLFSLALYLLFSLICSMADVNPLQTPFLGAIPALLALVFGLIQESFYGTAA